MVLDPLGIHMQKINLETNLIPHKINSERHMGINVKYKIIKFLEDNIEKNLDDDLSDIV